MCKCHRFIFIFRSIRRLPILKGETKMIKPITNMKDAFSLSGMNAVITGGNRGLGLGIAKSLTELQGGKMEISCDGVLFKVVLRFPLIK